MSFPPVKSKLLKLKLMTMILGIKIITSFFFPCQIKIIVLKINSET